MYAGIGIAFIFFPVTITENSTPGEKEWGGFPIIYLLTLMATGIG